MGKCSSVILGANWARTNIRLTGFVRGTSFVLIFSSEFGSGRSSDAPLRIDFNRGASWSCLYEFGSWCACREGIAW